MKDRIFYLASLSLMFIVSCTERKEDQPSIPEEMVTSLPFMEFDLKDLGAFKKVSENWQIAGGVYADRNQDHVIQIDKGTGILVNVPEEGKKENLYTQLEHGDIELELDVMMPKNSNSGIYFQGRYEVQLFDSWREEEPKFGDMGGIYQRWDDTKKKDEEGFEGYAPKTNAAKSPGLWQHLKIIFHAPKFDASGNKVKNAWFEKVWLNGALIHQNIVVSGPTRGGITTKEVPKAPLFIQGDHGPVAFRNIKYKLYGDSKVELVDVRLKEYENTLPLYHNLDSLVLLREVQTDSIAATMATGVRPQKLLHYVGKLKIPEAGDYIFNYRLNRAGGAFLIDADTIISMNGNYNLDSLRTSKVSLQKGEVPFQLIYNKHVPWQIGFGLYVEGPGVQEHALHAISSLNLPREGFNPDFMIALEDEPVTQRGFWMHEGEKRTHCIAVGNPQRTHFAYDLEIGSLLQVWNGDFMDATKMWQGRGEKQLGVPAGFVISLHGDPEIAVLKADDALWPNRFSNPEYKQLRYEFDKEGFPIFTYQVGSTTVSNQFNPLTTRRGLKRTLTIMGTDAIWLKVADGSEIQQLPDGAFVVNNESFLIDFERSDLEPEIRKSGGVDQLLVKIPAGEQKVEYSIIW